jgi:hypothetical protein
MSTTAADAYPTSRFNRSPYVKSPQPVTVQQAASPPRSRHFAIEIGSAAFSRTTISTPRLIGPVIVQSVVIEYGVGGSPAPASIEMGWSRSPITEANVSWDATKAWNALQQRMESSFTNNMDHAVGFVHLNIAGTTYIENYPTPFLIAEPELYLVVSYTNSSGLTPGASICQVQLVEGVSPEVALNFH